MRIIPILPQRASPGSPSAQRNGTPTRSRFRYVLSPRAGRSFESAFEFGRAGAFLPSAKYVFSRSAPDLVSAPPDGKKPPQGTDRIDRAAFFVDPAPWYAGAGFWQSSTRTIRRL